MLFAILATALVGRAEQFEHRDQLAALTIPDFEEWDAADVLHGKLDLRGGIQHRDRGGVLGPAPGRRRQ
jgi:hypothetical protein